MPQADTSHRRTSDSSLPFPSTHPSPHPKRGRRVWTILGGIILLLALLTQFNPLHPVIWWQHAKDEFHQGEEAAVRDSIRRARHDSLAKLRAMHTMHATPSPLSATPR